MITGIGHEIDVSVADMVAHTYCVTPTDVARFLVAKADELRDYLLGAGQVLSLCTERAIKTAHQRLENCAIHLEHVGSRWTITAYSRLKSLAYAIHAKVQQRLLSRQRDLARITAQLKVLCGHSINNQDRVLDTCYVSCKNDMQKILDACTRDVQSSASSLKQAGPAAVKHCRDLLDRREHEVMLMHPSRTLMRGYSITRGSDGMPITQAESVELGESITTVVQKGTLISTVYDKEPS